MINPIGKMPKTHNQKEICNVFFWKKLMVYKMETIGISVISIGLLWFILGMHRLTGQRSEPAGFCL